MDLVGLVSNKILVAGEASYYLLRQLSRLCGCRLTAPCLGVICKCVKMCEKIERIEVAL